METKTNPRSEELLPSLAASGGSLVALALAMLLSGVREELGAANVALMLAVELRAASVQVEVPSGTRRLPTVPNVWRYPMRDVVMVATVVAFFALAVAYVRWCERVVGSDDDLDDAANDADAALVAKGAKRS